MKKTTKRKTGGGFQVTTATTIHAANGLVIVEVRESLSGDILVKFEEHGFDGPKVLIGRTDTHGNIHYGFWKESK